MIMKSCLGCDAPIEPEQSQKTDGLCDACDDKLRKGKRVKNSGGDRYAGRGLRYDPFVF